MGDNWLVWLGLIVLLVVIAAAVWFLLRRPTGTTGATPRSGAGTAPRSGAGPAAPPEPGVGEARVAGMSTTETGHGAPGAGTAGVVGAGAGASSAGHGSPGTGTADLPQTEGYGAPGPDSAAQAGAGSAAPADAGTAAPAYGAGADRPYDQVAEDASYGVAGQDEQREVPPAATGEHWTPPGADVGGSAPGAPVEDTGATGSGYPTEPADGSYEVPVDESTDEGAFTARDEAYATDTPLEPTATETAADVPPAAYPGGGTTTTEETGAATAWDSGATTEPAEAPASDQAWEDTRAGGQGTWTTEATDAGAGGQQDWAAEQPGAADATLAAGPEADTWTTADTDAGPHPTDDTMTSGAEVPTTHDAGAAYPGPMDDTAASAPAPATDEPPAAFVEETVVEETTTVEQAPLEETAVVETPRYEQDTLIEDQAGAAGAVGSTATDTASGQAGDYGYDEAHYGATSSGGFAPGLYGPGSATPAEDGSGPTGWSVKGNAGSMLFHTPDSPSYEGTRAEVWFESEEAAREAGFAHWDRKRR